MRQGEESIELFHPSSEKGKPAERRGHKADGSCEKGRPGYRSKKTVIEEGVMKLRFLVILFSVMLAAGLGGTAFAYHSGGVADCDGCHAMHGMGGAGSPEAPMNGMPTYKGNYLLQGSDASSTCLNCHCSSTAGSYHVATFVTNFNAGAPLQRNPGGDFSWLLVNYSYASHSGGTINENGQDHGHNIVSIDYGFTADTTYTTAPGGTMSSSALACNSCHDPHSPYRRTGSSGSWVVGTAFTTPGASGTTVAAANPVPIMGSGSSTGAAVTPGYAVGVYRLLAGPGYTNSVMPTSITFQGVPVAVAPSTYNQVVSTSGSGYTENTYQVRVAYGDGRGSGTAETSWSLWCASCHPNFGPTGGSQVHPTDQVLGSGPIGGFGSEASNYNAYVSSGNFGANWTNTAGGSQGPFTSLVPFASGGANGYDYANLATLASNTPAGGSAKLAGPIAGTDTVTCLSCHRAHASGFPHMLRWNNDVEFDTIAAGTAATGVVAGTPIWPGTDNGGGSYALGRSSAQMQAAYYDRAATVFGAYQRVIGCNKCHAKD
jgi:predicted CXXCH cytochrome family protein